MEPKARSGALARSASVFVISSALLLATPAAAAVVEFSNITGTWSNAVGGSNVNYSNGASSVRWGTTNGQQSGYDFVSGANFTDTVTPPGSSGFVTLGTFRHINFPINSGTSITGIRLNFSANVKVDGVLIPGAPLHFTYNFTHFETPNGSNPCADGGAQGVGVNINGCADRVTMNFNSVSDAFMIDGQAYTLNVAGFLVGGNPSYGFWTTEDAVNTATIRGKIDLLERVQSGVPEPSTWALMIAGFGAAGATVRAARRRNVLA